MMTAAYDLKLVTLHLLSVPILLCPDAPCHHPVVGRLSPEAMGRGELLPLQWRFKLTFPLEIVNKDRDGELRG